MELVALHCDKSVLSRDAVMEARQSRLASPHPTLDLPLNHTKCSLPTLDLNIAAAPYQVPLAVVLLWIFGYCHLARYHTTIDRGSSFHLIVVDSTFRT